MSTPLSFPLRGRISISRILIPVLVLLFAITSRANIGATEKFSTFLDESVVPGEPGPESSVREITGYVTGQGSMLPNVRVAVKDSSRETITDKKGFYHIKAAKGEVLVFSHLGLKSMEIIVEDVTRKLDVSLVRDSRMLSEVKLNASGNSVEVPETFDSNYGKVDRKKLGFTSNYLAGENLNLAGVDLVDALRGKIPGYRVYQMNNRQRAQLRLGGGPPLWEIDGVLFEREPPYIDLTTIESINVIRSPGGIARYGSLGSGGVIIVRTIDKAMAQRVPQKINVSSGTNKNFYDKDAVSFKNQSYAKPSYYNSLVGFTSSEVTLENFEKYLPIYKEDATFYLDYARQLMEKSNDKEASLKVLDAMQDNLFYDPVGLKSLAYFYQEKDMDLEALRVYLRVLSLRPEYAQSYRDLANTYRSIGMIENSWNYYMIYLNKVKSLAGSSIGETIYHEMEEIHYRMPKGFRPKEAFVSKTPLKDVPKDLRLIFEWDSSEAEFELEFVNPQGQAYSFIHTYEYNAEQINDEKTRGYSSREYIIDELDQNGWLVNLTYFGNKSNKPTYLKVTEIRNWARKGQNEKVDVLKLVEKNKKFQLVKI
jgi:tetratricopeptide (TPR) repeat protein